MADIFISHSSKDRKLAERICDELEERGMTCWIAPRDITPGKEWAGEISAALRSTPILLLIYSENSAQSIQVPREISLAKKNGAKIVAYRIDDTPVTPELDEELADTEWVAGRSELDIPWDELYVKIEGKLAVADRRKSTKAKKAKKKVKKKASKIFIASLIIILSLLLLNILAACLYYYCYYNDIVIAQKETVYSDYYANEVTYTDPYGHTGIYKGYWTSGLPDGLGTFEYKTDAGIVSIKSVFENGETSDFAEETIKLNDGTTEVYEGGYCEGKRNGFGMLNIYAKDGETLVYSFRGMFENGSEAEWRYNEILADNREGARN